MILKSGDITAVLKKGFKGSTENYRPVSISLIVSKVFIIIKQIANFMNPLL